MAGRSSSPVYGPDEIDFLTQHGSGGTVQESRTISAAFLSPLGSDAPRSAPSSSSLQPSANSPSIEVPQYKTSVAAIEFCGFTRIKALELFERYLGQADNDFNDGLKAFLVDCIDSAPSGLDWETFFEVAGIRAELQEALMNPKHAMVRDLVDPKFWIADTIEDRYHLLESANRYVKMHIAASNIDSIEDAGAEPEADPKADAEGEAETQDIGDHVTLWKGLNNARLQGLIDNGNVVMQNLTTGPAFDFTRLRGWLSLTPTRELAVRFANYAREKNYNKPDIPAIVQFSVPKQFIASLACGEIWTDSPNDLWRKVVWTNRSTTAPRSTEVVNATNFDLIRGHMTTGPSEVWKGLPEHTAASLNRHQHFTKMDDGESRPSIQWVFSPGAIERLGLELKDNVFIKPIRVI